MSDQLDPFQAEDLRPLAWIIVGTRPSIVRQSW